MTDQEDIIQHCLPAGALRRAKELAGLSEQIRYLRKRIVAAAACGHINPDPFFTTGGGKITLCDTLCPATNVRSYRIHDIVRLALSPKQLALFSPEEFRS